MKKPASRIRNEIARLQEQLKAAEAREAERIGRLALKAGLGDLEVEEPELQAALAELAVHFRTCERQASFDAKSDDTSAGTMSPEKVSSGVASRSSGEA